MGKFHTFNDSIFYAIVVPISINSKIIGYTVNWRELTSTKNAVQQINNLIGSNAAFYIANSDGTVFNNLINKVSSPPINFKSENNVTEYSRNGNSVIAAKHNIPGTPWLVLIELSKDVILRPVYDFLIYLIIISIFVLLIGLFIAWILSRSITTPLNNLTVASSSIAAGDYSSLVKINQKDEIGKLAEAFNLMAVKVNESKTNLEKKVSERTTELKSANDNLRILNNRLKELDELKTNFFTNVSHELRTPLALILGPSEKLIMEADLLPEFQRDVKVIRQNAKILLKQVNNLLDLAKLEVGKMELEYSEFDLGKDVILTASYFDSLAAEKEISFQLINNKNIIVQADRNKIQRVLLNLFSNAFKYTPKNGTIICSLNQNNDEVLFEIKDSGPGVDPALIGSIFQRFQNKNNGLSTHLGSTGLGLSIAKEFVEIHGGEINVFNDENGGAIFRFTIPSKVSKEVEIQQTAVAQNEELNFLEDLGIDPPAEETRNLIEVSEKNFSESLNNAPIILVVEDNIEMNRFIANILGKNYNVTSAYNGKEGFQKAVSIKPDLIITDIMMPEMTGDKFVEEVKKVPALDSVPIILLTAKTDEELKISLLKIGAYDYLNKPFTIDELLARVQNSINLKIIRDSLQKELDSRNNDIFSLVHEITERKHIIENSLKEKEVLLKEVHHRVKNNLQIISSLLNLQENSFTDPKEAFKESQNRIRSMSLVHEKLYQTKNYTTIDFKEYIIDIINNLMISYKQNNEIRTITDIKDFYIDINLAISLGLIITELVSNSLKYAFSNNSNSENLLYITVTKLEENKYCMMVKDNGIGIPEDFDLWKSETLGLQLVTIMVEQINGNVEVTNSTGTKYEITFTTKPE